MTDRWQAAASKTPSGPKRRPTPPLKALSLNRAGLLEVREVYFPPANIGLSEDYLVGWPVTQPPDDPRLFPISLNFGVAGMPMTRDEAYLAGAFGRQGVDENLDMIVTAYMEADASPRWIEENIERPAIEKITAIFGRGRGKPPLTDQGGIQKSDTRRKRQAARRVRGLALLEKYLSGHWRFVVFHGFSPLDDVSPDQLANYWKEGNNGD